MTIKSRTGRPPASGSSARAAKQQTNPPTPGPKPNRHGEGAGPLRGLTLSRLAPKWQATTDRRSCRAAAELPPMLPRPPVVNPPLGHASREVIAGAVVLLQVVQFCIRDDTHRSQISGVDVHLRKRLFQRSAIENDELHEFIQRLTVLDSQRVGDRAGGAQDAVPLNLAAVDEFK